MKFLLLLVLPLLVLSAGLASSQTDGDGLTEIFTDSSVYTEGQPLLLYGAGDLEESLIVRLRAPDGSFVVFDQIEIGAGGTFNHILLVWPEASAKFPYGTYAIEIIDSTGVLVQSIDIKFTSTDDLVEIPIERRVNTLVFAPETSALGTTMRIFVQTTSDGLLIDGDASKILRTTHIHLPDGTVTDVADEFNTLHRGLYYVDYVPQQLGTYVFHAVTFYHGTISHGSSATTIISQDIQGISEQIIQLNQSLDETSMALDTLKSEIGVFGSTLQGADQTINSSIVAMSESVGNIAEASLQLNSLLFPIVGSIAVIVALQIAILARRK